MSGTLLLLPALFTEQWHTGMAGRPTERPAGTPDATTAGIAESLGGLIEA
ncbi:MAG: hypothetical protein AMXMBFR13_01710 [Phycisphaerae bacterium]